MNQSPKPPQESTDNVLVRWQVTAEELTAIIDANPSLRGFMLGYLGEHKLRGLWFSDPRIEDFKKYDDHDRTRKGDMAFNYKNVEIRVEVKSLQTNTVKPDGEGWRGTFQCDASDRRKVKFPDGHEIETTCLYVGEFDLLAVSLFAFGGGWRYAFAKNADLPRTTTAKYPENYREYLLKSSMAITWPLKPPFRDEPFGLLDELAREAKKRT